MPKGRTFYDRDDDILCVECGWRGIVSEARHGRQKPGSPHYCTCPDCSSLALEKV